MGIIVRASKFVEWHRLGLNRQEIGAKVGDWRQLGKWGGLCDESYIFLCYVLHYVMSVTFSYGVYYGTDFICGEVILCYVVYNKTCVICGDC